MSIQPAPPITAGVTTIAPFAADHGGDVTDGGRHTDVDGSTRTCGRCRVGFPIGADVHPMELRDWWACAACTEALLPTRRHRSPT